VVPQAAADKAGLLSGDLITKVDGRNVSKNNQIVTLINDKDPGDVVVLSILRKDETKEFRVTLGHRSVTFELFNRNMQMSGPVSKRKDNFPMIFQHDLPLPKEAMGGPVFDLNGKCLGINIARVDRVTVFSLPSKIVRERLDDFLSGLDTQ
jgi:S1-C subfamily serine protease